MDYFRSLVELFNEVFEAYDSIGSPSHLQRLLTKPEFYAIVTTKDDDVIGGLTAYELPRYYSDKSELYLYDIAVKRQCHNQGIGKALMQHLKDLGTQNGIETIFVDAHSEDKQAVKFYEATIGKSEMVDHFTLEINPELHTLKTEP